VTPIASVRKPAPLPATHVPIAAPASVPIPATPAGARTGVSFSSEMPPDDSAPWPSPKNFADPSALPKHLDGHRLNDIVSCGSVNDIAWRFRPDSRKARLLIRDRLRLNSEQNFAIWEINQVMDRGGTVTFIFSRIESDRRSESIVIKDNLYNRIVRENGRNRVMEVQDLRTLINRAVLVFHHADGGSISFAPGLAGQSAITIELNKSVRPLSPILVKGNYCERLDEDSESASTSTARAAAEAAGAAATGKSGASK
jgi:hypothetical protein